MHCDPEIASAEVQNIAYHSPYLFGIETSRWRLVDFKKVVSWLSSVSIPGVGKILKRLQVSYKRGRMFLHSPDKEYDKKLAIIRNAKEECFANPGKVVFLYEDEHTFGRYPTVALTYAGTGIAEKTAEQYAGYNCLRRIAGCLDISTGAFISRQRNHFTADQMGKFYQCVEEHYPDAEVIYIALDNWKVHFEPSILKELENRKSRIRLLRLPTYAPWTNPVEKVWRLFKQDITHMHPYTYDWATLRKTIDDWFEARREGSQTLLHTVGLHGISHQNTSAYYNRP